MISIKNVTKYYKTNKENYVAVKDLNLEINKGSIVGLIGPNGAGKSTTIKMITGILKPDLGEVIVDNIIPYKNRKKLAYKLGVMFGNRSSLIFQLPLYESLLLIRDMYNIKNSDFKNRISYYTDILEVRDIINKPVRTMSLGQRIKSELLVTLIHNPEILILDEPTIGLDIVARQNFRNVLRILSKDESKTILLTSHDLVDVQNSCDDVYLLNKGRIFKSFDRDSLKDEINRYAIILLPSNILIPEKLIKYVRESNDINRKLIIDRDKTSEIINEINELNEHIINYEISSPSLEDIVYEDYKA